MLSPLFHQHEASPRCLASHSSLARVRFQGASRNSNWARGHAWAFYGFTMVQRFLNEGSPCAERYKKANPTVPRYIETTTVTIATKFLANLPKKLQVCSRHRPLPLRFFAALP